MGYYSDVAIAMKKEDALELIQREKAFEYSAIESACKHIIADRVIIFSWSSIKWYEDYEDVGRIERFLNELSSLEKPYKKVIIGEEYEDVEVIDEWVEEDDDTDIVSEAIYPVRYISIEGEIWSEKI